MRLHGGRQGQSARVAGCWPPDAAVPCAARATAVFSDACAHFLLQADAPQGPGLGLLSAGSGPTALLGETRPQK